MVEPDLSWTLWYVSNLKWLGPTIPRQIAIFWLPPPLGVEIIRSTMVGACVTVFYKRAILGLIQRIGLVPNPISFKYVTPIIPVFEKSYPFLLTSSQNQRTWWCWRWEVASSPRNPMREVTVKRSFGIQVEEASNEEEGDEEEAKIRQRWLRKKVEALDLLKLIGVGTTRWHVFWAWISSSPRGYWSSSPLFLDIL